MEDEISSILKRLIAEHYDCLKDYERGLTEMETHIAVIKANTALLKAQREIWQLNSSRYFAECARLYDIAQKTLDAAISNSNPGLADIALRVIEITHAKGLPRR